MLQLFRYVLPIWLLVTASASHASLVFNGTETPIPHSEWLVLESDALPVWASSKTDINQYHWGLLEQSQHRKGLRTNLLRADIHIDYTGPQRPMLFIPYAFIPEIKVGLAKDGRLLMWEDLSAGENAGKYGLHRSFGMIPLSIAAPGDYQILIQGSNVANSVIVNDARLVLSEDFLLHQFPITISVASSFIGGVFICLMFCVSLLFYRFQRLFFYALIFLVGALGTLLLREGVLFLSLPLDVDWWVKHILPFTMGMTFAGSLLYVGSDLKRTGSTRGAALVSLCGWVPLSVGALNIVFPTKDHISIGATGFAFALLGFVSALVLIAVRAWRGGVRNIIFALVFGSFYVAILTRAIAALSEKTTTISPVPWYVTIVLVGAYIFGEYILSLTRAHIESESRKTADSTRFDLVSRFSHELRTPLNAVIGLADLLKESKEIEKVQRLADMIHDAGNTLLQLVNDILDFSKLGRARPAMAEKSLRLDTLISTVVSGFMPQILSKRLHIKVFTEPGMPFFLIGDELRLKQILSNLFSNAIKFSPDDSFINVDIKQGERSEGRVELKFRVSDLGRGIPTDKLNSIFEPFAQVDSDDYAAMGGTGLGLAICKLLVEQMDGEIHAVSEENKGSTFVFNLWMEEDPAAPDLSRCFAALKGARILLRTAWSNVASPLQQHLAYWGAVVTVVNHVSDQLGESCDMVITDTGSPCSAADLVWFNQLPNSTAIHIIETKPADWVAQLQPEKNVRTQDIPSPILMVLVRIAEHLSGEKVELDKAMTEVDVLQNIHHKVLLVDDNTINLMVASKLLSVLNISSDMAQGGAIALEKLHSGKQYTLVLLDCEMPDIDGFEVCRRWRSHEREHNLEPLPIVALTAHALDEVYSDCLAVGMNDVLYKPVGRSDLVKLLNSYPDHFCAEEGEIVI